MASPLSFLAGGINGGEGLTASPFSADTHFTFTLKALIRGKPSLASWVELLCWLYGASGGEEERVLLRAENAKKGFRPPTRRAGPRTQLCSQSEQRQAYPHLRHRRQSPAGSGQDGPGTGEESPLEPNSHGFRHLDGTAGMNAIEAILLVIRAKPNSVLDADISK